MIARNFCLSAEVFSSGNFGFFVVDFFLPAFLPDFLTVDRRGDGQHRAERQDQQTTHAGISLEKSDA